MSGMGSLVANLGLNVSQFRSGASQARGILSGLGSNLKSQLGGIGGELTAMLGLGSAISALKFGIQLSTQAEQTAISFEVMLGSATKAKSMLAQLKNFADTSPYESAGTNQNAQTLINFGVQAQDVLPTMRMLGDVAAGDQEKFSRLSLTFGQMAASGRLMGGDLLQFINAGFNPLQEISKRTGESMVDLKKRMEDGGVSAGEIADSFKAATSEGGQFFQMTERQSQTTAGRFSTMKDGINTALKEAGDAILKNLDMKGVFDHINAFTEQVPFFFRNAGELIHLATIDWGIWLLEVVPYGEQVSHSLIAGFTAMWEGSKAGGMAFVSNIKAVFLEIRNLASATWASISAGIQALINDPFNAMAAARQAFEQELASQEQPEGGQHFATAFADTFKQTFSQTMKDLEGEGGIKSSLQSQKEELLKKISENELKFKLDPLKKDEEAEGKLGDSFNRDVKTKGKKGKGDNADSNAALFGSTEAAKIMLGGRNTKDKIQSDHLNVAQQTLSVLKSGLGPLSKITGKGALNAVNSFVKGGSTGIDPVGMATSIGSLGSNAIKSLFPGGPRPKTFGQRRNDRINKKRADELSNFNGLMGTVGGLAEDMWGSMMGNTAPAKPAVNAPSVKMASDSKGSSNSAKADPNELKLLQDISKGANQPPVVFKVVTF